MTLDLSFNLPQFDEEYEGHKMRVLVEELERLHAMLTNDTNADGIQVVGTPGETIIFEGDTIIYESTTSLVYPNCAGINWLNIAGSEIELLKFCEIAATGPTSNFGSDPSSDWTYSGVVATSANLATGGIENDSASKFLSGVAFSPDGLHALTGNSTNDRLWTYTLTTPYDFENATVDFNAGLSGIFATNVWSYQFINDGNYALVWDFDFNQLSRISLSPPYTIDSDFALVQSKTGVGLGYTVSTDAWVWMAEDGLNMISIGDKGGGVTWMRSFTLSTAFDLTTLVFANELNFDAVIGTPNSIRNIVASPDGLSLFIMHQASTERIELVTMTTPWDVSTGTVTGTYLDIDATAFTGVFDFMEVASDGGAIYVYTNAGDNRFVKYSRVGGAPAPPTSGAFYVGDPGYPLELDGTLIGLKNNIGINWDNVAGDNVELLNFEPVAATGDPYWASVAVLARLDGSDGQSTGYSTQDSTAFTTSFISSASLSSDQVPFTSLTTSLKLDGGSMYMVISNSSNVFLAGSDFTVEGWGYYTEDPTTGGGACLMSVYSPSPNREWIFSHRASGKLEFIVSATGSSNIAVISETFVPTLNQWYHLRVTRSGNSWRLFIDGVQLGSTATNSTTIHSGTGGVQIGSFVGGFERWAGYISNARITIGVARSIANFTPPTDSFPVVLGEAAIPESLYVGDPAYPTELDGTLIGLKNNIGINWDNVAGDNVELLNLGFSTLPADTSFANVTLLLPLSGADESTSATDLSDSAQSPITFVQQAKIDSAVTQYGENTLLLDGTEDSVNVADDVGLSFGADVPDVSGHFLVELDVYFTNDPGTSNQCFISKRTDTGSQREWYFGIRNNLLTTIISTSGNNGIIMNQPAWNPVAGQWYKLAWEVTRTAVGSGDETSVYVDGVLLNTTPNIISHPTIFSGTSPLRIGGYEASGSLAEDLDGRVANVRITKDLIRYNHASYTPETGPFPTAATEQVDTEFFFVGDPVYQTRIDGSNVLISTAQTTITGNVDIAGTLHAGGAVDFNSTLDVLGVSNLLGGSISGDPGTEGSSVLVNDVAYSASSKVSDIGGTNAAQFLLHRHSTTLPSVMLGVRSKTDDNTHAVMADNDVLMTILAAGWDGVTTYSLSSEIRFEVDGTPGNNDMPGQITFMTAADGTQTPLERMRIRSTGDVEIDNALDITGALTALSYGGILEANLLSRIANESVSGAWDFTGLVEFVNVSPEVVWRDTNAAADEKNWMLRNTSGFFALSTGTDAAPNTPVNNFFLLDRTGTTIDSAAIAATSITMTGTVGITGALTATSYGGITEANLLDKTATEVISGQWYSSKALSVYGGVQDVGQVGQFTWIDVDAGAGYGRVGSYNYDTAAWANMKMQGLNCALTPQGGKVLLQGNTEVSGGNLSCVGGADLIVYDATNTDFWKVDHDGTDCNFTFGGTTSLSLTGMTSVLVGDLVMTGTGATPLSMTGNQDTSYTLLVDNDSTGTTATARIAISSDTSNGALFVAGPNRSAALVTGGPTGAQVTLRGLGNYPIVFGTSNTSRMTISGAGAVDVVGALTAASYGGITEANLLDKTATETITGTWTLPSPVFTGTVGAAAITGTGAVEGKTVVSTDYYHLRTETQTNLALITATVNTDAGKVAGAMVWDITNGQPVWAAGDTDGALWVDGAGTTVHTPIA